MGKKGEWEGEGGSNRKSSQGGPSNNKKEVPKKVAVMVNQKCTCSCRYGLHKDGKRT